MDRGWFFRRILTPFLLVGALGTIVPSWVVAQTRKATVTGLVTDSTTGDPLSGVMVYLPARREALTDARGRFRLGDIETGRHLLFVRRIGYEPEAYRLTIGDSTGATFDIGTLRLQPLAVLLDPIVVESTFVAVNPRLAEFYRRMHGGMGDYITRDQIWKANPVLTSDLLRRLAGVQISCSGQFVGGGCTAVSGRGRGLSGAPCPMRVYVDGIPTSLSVDDIPPAWVAGIEVYKSSAFTPLEFGNSRCGTVVVWTGPDRYR